MPATVTLANAALNLIFGATTWSARPSTLYFGLFTTNPTITGGGVEVSGNNYARKAITANTTNFSDPATAGDNVTNQIAITWPRASGSWGTVTGWGIFDAATGGNLLFFEALATPVAIGASQTPNIASGALTFSLGGYFGDVIEQRFLRHFLRGQAWTAVGTHYFALGTGVTSAALTGEPSSSGYVRKSMSNNTTTWATAANGQKANGAAIAFATVGNTKLPSRFFSMAMPRPAFSTGSFQLMPM